jgi:hypothetical protein
MRPAYHSDPTPETGHRALPAMAGGSPEATAEAFEPLGRRPGVSGRIGGIHCPVIIGLTIAAAAGTVFFGIIPSPLVDFVSGAGESITAGLG